MDKRYQVFVSATYADLKEERQAVIKTVIEADCIPAGMELFPAVDEEQLTFIKRIIDDCDYYLLIIGGRYGSIDKTGISYTEQEYDYAVQKGLKVIALLHGSPEDIAFGKSEQDPELRQRLDKFKAKVKTGRLVKFWKTGSELPGLVALSLLNATKTYPAVGWVRANRAANEDVLNEINELRKANQRLQATLADLAPQPALDDLAGLDEPVKMSGTFQDNHYPYKERNRSVDTTWRGLFGYVSPYLVKHPADYDVKEIFTEVLFKASGQYSGGHRPSLDDQQFQTVGIQLQALGLIKLEYSETTGGGMGLFWSLTGSGQRFMVETRTVRTKTTKGDTK
jgi:hypothetical protein